MSKLIAVVVGQNEDLTNELEIHAASVTGDYDTLCGIDADDEALGHYGQAAPGDIPPKAKINCPQCRAIFFGIKELGLRATDFAKD